MQQIRVFQNACSSGDVRRQPQQVKRLVNLRGDRLEKLGRPLGDRDAARDELAGQLEDRGVRVVRGNKPSATSTALRASVG